MTTPPAGALATARTAAATFDRKRSRKMRYTSRVAAVTLGAAATAASSSSAISSHSASLASMKGTWRTSTGTSAGGSSARSWSPRRSITVRMPWSTSACHPLSLNCRTLSARTTAPYRVSPPSSVGSPPSSRTLRQPSQTRSLGCSCGKVGPAQRRRGRACDRDRNELAGSGVAAEVDGRVSARPAAQELRLRAARAFDEHLLDHPDAPRVLFRGDPLHDVDELLDALALHVVRHLIRHRGRLGPGARRVDEGESTVEADLLDDLERLAEVVLGLTGEAHDDVRREREVGDRCPKLPDEPQVALARVRPSHRLEDAARPRLEGQVGVLAHRVAVRHRGDHVAAEVLGMRAGEPDPLDALDRVDRAEELREARADVAAIRIDVLPEERDLANALGGELFDLRDD